MLNQPSVIQKSDESGNYHAMDLTSFLLSERLIVIEGDITPQVAETLNQMFLYIQSKEPSTYGIILSNTKCYEFRLIFALYESIKELKRKGFEITIQINGIVSEMAVLLAFMKFEHKGMRDSSMILINELKTDNTFPQSETQRLQASDLLTHLKYYEEQEKNYFRIMSEESGICVEEIEKLHERQNVISKERLQKELGFVFENACD